MFLFNVRVYGILVNAQQQVMISDERLGRVEFTKFPGGGLEYGEGLIDALKREFMEECRLEIDVVQHVYTTDFYEKSSFNDSQIISIYYAVAPSNQVNLDQDHPLFNSAALHAETSDNKELCFRMLPIDTVTEDHFTFRTDKVAWSVFVTQYLAK